MTHKWRAVADTLAAAMDHSKGGFCTLTDNEHAALVLHYEACKPGALAPRATFGRTDKPDHSEHAPDPQFVITNEGES